MFCFSGFASPQRTGNCDLPTADGGGGSCLHCQPPCLYHFLDPVDEAARQQPEAENCMVCFSLQRCGEGDRVGISVGYRLRLPSVGLGIKGASEFTDLLHAPCSRHRSAGMGSSSNLDPGHGIDRIHHLPLHTTVYQLLSTARKYS